MIHFTFNSAQTKEYLKDHDIKSVLALINPEEPHGIKEITEVLSFLNSSNRLFYIKYDTILLKWKWDVLIIQSRPKLQSEVAYLQDGLYNGCRDNDLAEVVWLTNT